MRRSDARGCGRRSAPALRFRLFGARRTVRSNVDRAAASVRHTFVNATVAVVIDAMISVALRRYRTLGNPNVAVADVPQHRLEISPQLIGQLKVKRDMN